MDTMTDARALIRAVYTEVHGQPTDPWAGKGGPGRFVEVLERHLMQALAANVRVEAMEGAAKNLAGEVRGALGIAEEEMRAALGNTNVNCLQRRMEEVRALLALPSNAGASHHG